MAEVESISHSGLRADDVRQVEEFWQSVLGAAHMHVSSGNAYLGHGGTPHPCALLGDYLFVVFPELKGATLSADGQLRGGPESYRHAFSVPRARFEAFLAHLKEEHVPFEGPVEHPHRGPLGESVYFKDSAGHFFEVCWRRDEDVEYSAVMVGEA
ncbi:MAG: hypothetical protein HW416_1300 [Chloroflexi bacterium]|nr:hypothetical protein [Chloroflexota bacterium]